MKTSNEKCWLLLCIQNWIVIFNIQLIKIENIKKFLRPVLFNFTMFHGDELMNNDDYEVAVKVCHFVFLSI